jgi:hypothetical protein
MTVYSEERRKIEWRMLDPFGRALELVLIWVAVSMHEKCGVMHMDFKVANF